MKKNEYMALPLKEKLVSKILIYYQTVWAEKRFTSSNHKLWLANFKGEEKLNSLYLLSKFMFFGSDEIRELLVSIYRDKFKYKIIEKFRLNNSNTTDLALINSHFEYELNNTRFVSLGKTSESGEYISMLFRQVNKLSTKNMRSSNEIIIDGLLAEPHVTRYIFIDDFCGSGSTAYESNNLVKALKNLNKAIHVSYNVLFAAAEGFENVGKYCDFDNYEASFILDKTFKCFEKDSRYFTESVIELDKDETKKFCTAYGGPLVDGTPIDGHPLGFNDGQLLISMAHNTPDNTLPIFWSDKNWHPIFLRYTKIKH
jgi:hypothetical protein